MHFVGHLQRYYKNAKSNYQGDALLFSLLKIKSPYMFRAFLSHLQELLR
jgi:hypothetical protein